MAFTAEDDDGTCSRKMTAQPEQSRADKIHLPNS
jgi:hypothetical protein